ncbi:hypothetical protein SLEP1_g348 [Rubroshorea leprosula]|uniref:At4g14310 8-bladed propeller domain-containing protein n=1 Tax=Rubroshorea leprosula TaxID=152421 RepID=A0AAV5HGV3_9ROSI|nr:hypothetical protein SLEP1_g348 [Rubroshorea leprosula]
MSASSVRNQRDLNAGTQKPAKSLTPISNPTLKKSSSGKENSRHTVSSRAALSAQKPVIRPVPRVEKPAVVGGGGDREARVRWSTSSAPRGRSPSPSEFIRAVSVSDLRRDRVSRVSADRDTKGSRDLKAKRSGSGLRTVKNCNESCQFGENLVLKVKESGKKAGGVRALSGKYGKDVNLSSDLVQSSEINGDNCSFKACTEKNCSDFGSNVEASVKAGKKSELKSGSVLKTENRFAKMVKDKSLRKGKALEAPKEKGVSEEKGLSCGVGVKYPSKLHERLAFLEGKVKRIASDIKMTKEMLDLNNPDESKVILSDIQDKISGIEKAMNHVAGDSDGKAGVLKSSKIDKIDAKIVEKSQGKQGGKVNVSVKGLNSGELEDRLFPHHKLLRNRASLKASSGSNRKQETSNSVDPSSQLKKDQKSLGSMEDNPIAIEFLASLDREQNKVNTRKGPAGLEHGEIQEMDGAHASHLKDSSTMFDAKSDAELVLMTDERLEDFDDQENGQSSMTDDEVEDINGHQLNKIGCKATTAGWFVSEGEAVLAHDDGSCSFYDIVNSEEKAVYKPPAGVSPNMWRDCWIIRAPSADGCSGRYVVAASAGNSLESGFCSWDFYTKDVRAFHVEAAGTTTSRTVLGPLSNNPVTRGNSLCNTLVPQNRQWWYKPCGPLIMSTASSQKVVKVYDIRDGEQIMRWEVQKPVIPMDYSSPLQWRNRGKIVVAEAETISLWDVNSLHPQALQSVSSSGQKITALHVNNTDAELVGGVRQRVSSSEVEGNDGVFCTPDSINILDLRHPSGIGAKIPKTCSNVHSVFSRGDSVFLGCTNVKSAGLKQPCSQVQQFSLRRGRLYAAYSLPESNAHLHHSAIKQVWGSSNHVMGVCGLGLFAFDASMDDNPLPSPGDYGATPRETIGTDDLYSPTFDYLSSRVLLISRDRPALWKHIVW